MLDACPPPPCTPFGEIEPTPAAKKKARKNAVSKAASGDMPSYVDIQCRQVNLADGSHVAPLTFKIKASLNVREAPSVELDPNVLHYIKYAMQASDGSIEKETPAKAVAQRTPHVQWRAARNCWTAKHGSKFKTFKPDDITDPISIEVAHGKAARWASGEDCDADDGAEADQFDGNIADDAVDANVDDCHDDDDATVSSIDSLASDGVEIPADSGDATSTESVAS